MKTKITKRVIDSAKPDEGKDRVYIYDTELTGFGVTKYETGKASFFVLYGTTRRRCTLGRYGVLTVEAARIKAKSILADIAEGIDPLDTRAINNAIPTFSAFVTYYMKEITTKKKTYREDQRYLTLACDAFGHRRIDRVTRPDIANLMKNLSLHGNTFATANRFHASVRTCLQEALACGYIRRNPASGIKHYPEPVARDRTLSSEEMTRLFLALDNEKNEYVKTAFYVLIETGCRKSEVLSAKWEHIDFGEMFLTLPATKAGKRQFVPLAKSTLERLKNLPRAGAYIFPSGDGTSHRADIKRQWERIRKEAAINDVHIHDIRRTFGLSIARLAGLQTASTLLRHSNIKITNDHYAQLGLDDLRPHLERRTADIISINTAAKSARKESS